MNRLSKTAVFIIIILLSAVRINYATLETKELRNVLTWDAFGYYLYLPAEFIYTDVKKMDWVPEIVEKYQTTGPVYQLSDLPNGNKVMKYLMGISILYSPFFIIGHAIAEILDYPADGFSPPYQIAIFCAAIFYACMGLLIMRWVLLKYFSDLVTAFTLILITLATNYPQYISVDSGQTHGYIFALYAAVLALTFKWHTQPSLGSAFFIGLIIGLATISRPTEIVMIFIPILFNLHSSKLKFEKTEFLKQNPLHILYAITGGFIGILPQLLYWKRVTGDWVYDVGSKWTFFDPNWQVLIGWEKGWFIYTPLALFMVAGIFYLRKNPFYWPVLIYFIVNTWIIISWSDWRYGASYSSRALVQSYAVMALPLAAMVSKLLYFRFRYIFYVFASLLIFVNLFQIWQYNKTILHYDDMNKYYYKAIFLNPSPSPVQMSLLDTKEYIKNENEYMVFKEIKLDSQFTVNAMDQPKATLLSGKWDEVFSNRNARNEYWLKISVKVFSDWGAFGTKLFTSFDYDNTNKTTSVRMENGICKRQQWNKIEYYFKVPKHVNPGNFSVFIETEVAQNIHVKDIIIKALEKH
jgi:hypothetical protein